MPDKEKKPEHSKLADIERLKMNRYMTRGAGQFERQKKKALPAPTIAKLRNDVAKVVKKVAKKKAKKRSRR